MLSKGEKDLYKKEYRIGDKIGFDVDNCEITMVHNDYNELNKFQGNWTILGYEKQGVICQYLCENVGYPTYVPFVALEYISENNKQIDNKVTLENIEAEPLYVFEQDLFVFHDISYENKTISMYFAIEKAFGTIHIKEFTNKEIRKLIKIGY